MKPFYSTTLHPQGKLSNLCDVVIVYAFIGHVELLCLTRSDQNMQCISVTIMHFISCDQSSHLLTLSKWSLFPL